MNIHEFGVNADPLNPSEPKPPHWWVFLYVSVPSTLALAVLMYGFFWWRRARTTREARNQQIGSKDRSLC